MDYTAQRKQMLAVFFLAALGAGLFFLAGRLSVKVLPFDSANTVANWSAERAVDLGTPPPVRATEDSRETRAAPSRTASETSRNLPAPTQVFEKQAVLPVGPEQKNEERALVVPTVENQPASKGAATSPRLVIINSGADTKHDPAAATAPPAANTDDPAVGQCERRYSSFRRSDGTYQPFDGGARRRCPLLR